MNFTNHKCIIMFKPQPKIKISDFFLMKKPPISPQIEITHKLESDEVNLGSIFIANDLTYDKINKNYSGNLQCGTLEYEGVFSEKDIMYGTLKTTEFLYCGEFQNFTMNGNGQLRFFHPNNIVKFVGNFNCGKFSGWGSYLDKDGNCHEGEFYLNVKQGKFNTITPTGHLIETQYKDGLAEQSLLLSPDTVFNIPVEYASQKLHSMLKFLKGPIERMYDKISGNSIWMTKDQCLNFTRQFELIEPLKLRTTLGYVLPYQFIEVLLILCSQEHPRHLEKLDISNSLHWFFLYSINDSAIYLNMVEDAAAASSIIFCGELKSQLGKCTSKTTYTRNLTASL
eukprot:NODE_44_length_33449_cov_1.575742.p10 type:complete len:339 gc:universal NODE_44_length_33449_cov_1.575742:25115-24099(-)